MNNEQIYNIVRMREAVALLAEHNSWWNTRYFDSSANEFIEYLFPKTKIISMSYFGYAAKFMLDVEVGANYYHLFRLPVQVEEKLYKKINLKNEEQLSRPDAALSFLKELSEDLYIEKHTGPINIGSSELIDKDVIQAIAAHYLSAFVNDYKVHPYLN